MTVLRSAARHSALRGDTLTSLLNTVVEALRLSTGATGVAVASATPQGEDVLLVHEVGLLDAWTAAGTDAIEVDDTVTTDALAGAEERGWAVAAGGAAWLPLRGVAGPVSWIRLAPPAEGWETDHDALPLARELVDELGLGLLRHWAEQQHLDRAAALLEAQRHTHVGCFEWDIVADKVRWSDELYRIFGAEPQSFEPTFEEFLERIHDDDRDAVRASVYDAYEHHSDYRIEERIIRPDGTIRQLASWGHVIVGEDSVPVKIVGSCQDVTDARAATEELAAAERRLAEVHERRNQALELNDSVVQGLAAALFAIEQGMTNDVQQLVSGTLDQVRGLISELLDSHGVEPRELSLRRTEPARPFLVRDRPFPASPAASHAIRLLIADDSSDIRLLVRMMMAAETDFHVIAEAADGSEAVNLAKTHRPDMVLLDLAMPELDGMQAIPAIVGAVPDAVIVVFSGFAAEELAQPAFDQGAHAYVEKGLIDISLPRLLREIRASAVNEAGIIRRARGRSATA